MNRYIDADVLRKNEIARCHCVPCVGSNDNNYKDLDEVLNDTPTADVVEVRHGEWREVNDKYPRYVCTVCNHLFNNKNYNYCPCCGAKMDGERSENGKS